VRSTLIVGEGMGHCYIYQSNLPEARDRLQVIVSFFGKPQIAVSCSSPTFIRFSAGSSRTFR